LEYAIPVAHVLRASRRRDGVSPCFCLGSGFSPGRRAGCLSRAVRAWTDVATRHFKASAKTAGGLKRL